MFPHTVTVYNKHREDGEEKWQRTVLYGVFWNAISGAVMRRTGATSTDSVQIIIPMAIKASRNEYRPPKEWAALTDKTGYWTLQPGDVVVKGALDVEIDRSTKELQGYDDVLTITSVDTKGFGSGMDHWEVSGK